MTEHAKIILNNIAQQYSMYRWLTPAMPTLHTYRPKISTRARVSALQYRVNASFDLHNLARSQKAMEQ